MQRALDIQDAAWSGMKARQLMERMAPRRGLSLGERRRRPTLPKQRRMGVARHPMKVPLCGEETPYRPCVLDPAA